MSQKINYSQAQFLLSVAQLKQLPLDKGIEVAFAGRSNAGKSSALNRLTANKNLARTSKTPGRTRLINFFALDDTRRLVDLPGYGYAKVPLAIKEQWQRTLSRYLQTRQCLQGIVLLMDARHPLKEFDQQMLNWAQHYKLAAHILLTKADKLTRGQAHATLLKVRQAIQKYDEKLVTVQLFSAVTSLGLPELVEKLSLWFTDNENER